MVVQALVALIGKQVRDLHITALPTCLSHIIALLPIGSTLVLFADLHPQRPVLEISTLANTIPHLLQISTLASIHLFLLLGTPTLANICPHLPLLEISTLADFHLHLLLLEIVITALPFCPNTPCNFGYHHHRSLIFVLIPDSHHGLNLGP